MLPLLLKLDMIAVTTSAASWMFPSSDLMNFSKVAVSSFEAVIVTS